MMIRGVPKCFGMREKFPMEIGVVPKVYRNKGEVFDGDRRETKGVSMQDKLNNMYLILIRVINN